MSATYDLKVGAGADVVLTVAPVDGATINALLIDGETITQAGNYTVSGNEITILTAYLDTLVVGTYDITIDMDAGADPVVELEVVDTTV